MYAVVGCSDCGALAVVEGRPETTECPRCGKRRRFETLEKFVETDDVDHAREVRASMLANRSGEGDAFADLDSFAELDDRVEGAAVSDEEYLASAGVDPDEVSAAGERADERSASTRRGSREDVVRRALRELDEPTADDVVDYAADRGVPAEAARAVLEKLTRRGAVSESRGRYRLL